METVADIAANNAAAVKNDTLGGARSRTFAGT